MHYWQWLKKNQIYFELIFLAWIWAAAFVGVRFLSTSIPPLLGATIRFLFASLFFSIFLFKHIPKLIYRQWIYIFLAALSGIYLYNFTFFLALQSVSASEAAIFMAITPALTALIGVLFLKEKLSKLGWIGIILALSGEMVILQVDTMIDLKTGEQFLTIAIFSFMIYGIIGKQLLKNLPTLPVISLVVITGTVMLVISLFFVNQPIKLELPFSNWLILIFLGVICTGIGNTIYYRGIKKIGLIKTTYFINLIPFFVVLQGALFLHEQLSFRWMTGGILILIGIIFVTKKYKPVTTNNRQETP